MHKQLSWCDGTDFGSIILLHAHECYANSAMVYNFLSIILSISNYQLYLLSQVGNSKSAIKGYIEINITVVVASNEY